MCRCRVNLKQDACHGQIIPPPHLSSLKKDGTERSLRTCEGDGKEEPGGGQGVSSLGDTLGKLQVSYLIRDHAHRLILWNGHLKNEIHFESSITVSATFGHSA